MSRTLAHLLVPILALSPLAAAQAQPDADGVFVFVEDETYRIEDGVLKLAPRATTEGP